MKSPFFTVIIPTFNRAAKLPACLNSVLSQTFTDFEIVIIDNAFLEQDGSTTNAKRIDYDVTNATAKTSGNERVKMVIQPQKKTDPESL